MKILLLADTPDDMLWDHLDRRRLDGIELVISCGDLPANYLSFLTCFTNAPVLYVHGNHDTSYERKPPEGCVCIEDGVYCYKGLRIMGLGGSMRYKPGPYQYTDKEMARRVRRLSWRLRRAGGVDIVVTHAPLRGIGDADDLCHRGFESLKALVDRYHPVCLCHGHVHKEYTHQFKRERDYAGTRVINAWTSFVIEVDAPPEGKRRVPRRFVIT